MVAEDFLQDPGPAVARWRRADLDAAHLRQFAGRAVATQRSAASRANSSTATRAADRLMTLIWSSALSLFWKALRHNPSALTQPPNVCRLRGLHLKSPPRQLPCAPRATGDMGRASGPTGQGQATAEAVQRAASGMPQNTGPAAPAHRRPRAAACRAIGRSPTKSDLVGCSFKCSPSATTLEVRSTRNRHKSIILHGYSAQFWKSIQLLQQYRHF